MTMQSYSPFPNSHISCNLAVFFTSQRLVILDSTDGTTDGTGGKDGGMEGGMEGKIDGMEGRNHWKNKKVGNNGWKVKSY